MQRSLNLNVNNLINHPICCAHLAIKFNFSCTWIFQDHGHPLTNRVKWKNVKHFELDLALSRQRHGDRTWRSLHEFEIVSKCSVHQSKLIRTLGLVEWSRFWFGIQFIFARLAERMVGGEAGQLVEAAVDVEQVGEVAGLGPGAGRLPGRGHGRGEDSSFAGKSLLLRLLLLPLSCQKKNISRNFIYNIFLLTFSLTSQGCRSFKLKFLSGFLLFWEVSN